MEEIVKSFSDTKKYRLIQLDNQIQCLLISDQSKKKLFSLKISVLAIDISRFCLNIAVGALEDPLEVCIFIEKTYKISYIIIKSQGLAHVVEHFLLAGCEKYPNYDDFSNFLLNNSGKFKEFQLF